MRFGIPAQKPARGLRFDHWGATKVRAPTWRDRTSLYTACPSKGAARVGRSIKFIYPYLQPFAYLSSNASRSQLYTPIALVEAIRSLCCDLANWKQERGKSINFDCDRLPRDRF